MGSFAEYRYAINLADLMGLIRNDFAIQILINPVLSRETILAEGDDRMDGTAVIMTCETERSQAIIELLRRKYKKHVLRCYQCNVEKSDWKRI